MFCLMFHLMGDHTLGKSIQPNPVTRTKSLRFTCRAKCLKQNIAPQLQRTIMCDDMVVCGGLFAKHTLL